MQAEMLSGSELTGGRGDAEPVVNPKTGATILEIAEASPDQVPKAFVAAATARST